MIAKKIFSCCQLVWMEDTVYSCYGHSMHLYQVSEAFIHATNTSGFNRNSTAHTKTARSNHKRSFNRRFCTLYRRARKSLLRSKQTIRCKTEYLVVIKPTSSKRLSRPCEGHQSRLTFSKLHLEAFIPDCPNLGDQLTSSFRRSCVDGNGDLGI